jgi:UDP-2-acetamido-3-amino-2,3-dideoxy-glucuronate N-acetyltransferase
VDNPRSEIVRRGQYLKTLVKRGASIGANATIVCGVTIGRFAFIAAGAVINRDVPDYALMAGVPARRIGWMSEHGTRLQSLGNPGAHGMPDAEGELLHCPESGTRYLRQGDRVVRVDTTAAGAPQ